MNGAPGMVGASGEIQGSFASLRMTTSLSGVMAVLVAVLSSAGGADSLPPFAKDAKDGAPDLSRLGCNAAAFLWASAMGPRRKLRTSFLRESGWMRRESDS